MLPPTPAVTPGSARSPHFEAGNGFPQHLRETRTQLPDSAPPPVILVHTGHASRVSPTPRPRPGEPPGELKANSGAPVPLQV